MNQKGPMNDLHGTRGSTKGEEALEPVAIHAANPSMPMSSSVLQTSLQSARPSHTHAAT